MSVTYRQLVRDKIHTAYILVKSCDFFDTRHLPIIIYKTGSLPGSVEFGYEKSGRFYQALDKELTSHQVMFKLTPKLAKLYDVK